jgi:hypothetical protein
MVLRALLTVTLLLAAAVPVYAQEEDFGSEEPSLSAFVGTWSHHGVLLEIADDGSAQALWRTYYWCAPGVPEPCDRIEADRLISGGRAELWFTPTTAGIAAGEIVDTSDPSLFDVGPVELRLTEYGMAVLAQFDREIVMCGPRYLDEAPPEVIEFSPCGA